MATKIKKMSIGCANCGFAGEGAGDGCGACGYGYAPECRCCKRSLCSKGRKSCICKPIKVPGLSATKNMVLEAALWALHDESEREAGSFVSALCEQDGLFKGDNLDEVDQDDLNFAAEVALSNSKAFHRGTVKELSYMTLHAEKVTLCSMAPACTLPADEHPWVTNKKWKKRWSDMDAQERQRFVDWYNVENGKDVYVVVHAGKNDMLADLIEEFIPFRALTIVPVVYEDRLVILPDWGGPSLKGKAKRDREEVCNTFLILPNSIMLAREAL